MWTLNALEVAAILAAAPHRTVTMAKFGTEADTAKPWRGNLKTGGTTASATPDAVLIGPRMKSVGGEMVQKGDMLALIAGDGVNAFDQFDTLTDSSTVWNIVGSEIVGPGSEILLYKLLLRR